ncbi:hypothetical protein SAY86_020494 [Trapa natans]|uniref:Uncharacterized protein n=1 Tax=Trapa natans TaxID=22666 RepID=A0AAN7M2H1_TRANT|nr:hypothetical protein SAY86_020494 [Trapa natans]
MATITASLERSLQDFSLNHHGGVGGTGAAGFGRSLSSDDHLSNKPNTTLELNSHIFLPYHWEQCLDLQTGEIYYINWRTGMKMEEDPRVSANVSGTSYYYSDEDVNYCNSDYDSEEDSESSPASCSSTAVRVSPEKEAAASKGPVLVVGGCKACLMYYMVPKQVDECPKCGGQLLHFDRSKSGSSL